MSLNGDHGAQSGEKQIRVCTGYESKGREEERVYRRPLIVRVGRAEDLVQGHTGKYSDGYTGYNWER